MVPVVHAVELEYLVVYRAQHFRETLQIELVAFPAPTGHVEEGALDHRFALRAQLVCRRPLKPANGTVAAIVAVREVEGLRAVPQALDARTVARHVVLMDGHERVVAR